MFQQRRAILLPSLGTLLLSLLIGLFLFGRRRREKSNTSGKVVTHEVKTSPEDTLAYWTEDRMRDAKPAPMPMVDERHLGKRPSDSSHS